MSYSPWLVEFVKKCREENEKSLELILAIKRSSGGSKCCDEAIRKCHEIFGKLDEFFKPRIDDGYVKSYKIGFETKNESDYGKFVKPFKIAKIESHELGEFIELDEFVKPFKIVKIET